MLEFTSSPLFGIVLSLICFEFGAYLNQKKRSALTNPLLIGIVVSILIIKTFNIPIENYNNGGKFISMFLPPVTSVLAVTIYNQLDTLKKNFLPIFVGVLAGSVTAMTSAYFLCKMFKLDQSLISAMIPKSVTMPIATEISRQIGGNVSVTVAAVIVTGMLGAIFSPVLIKIFRIKDPVARGVAIGTSTHAMGTTKALEIGEIEGAMSGVCIGIAGVVTVVIAMFL